MKKFFSIFLTLLFLCIFCFSAYQMYSIYNGYSEGDKEYASVAQNAVVPASSMPGVYASIDEADYPFDIVIDFEELRKMNKDTVGWIRFAPEPATISYPIVHTIDNDTYLHRTFSGKENTLGSIFMDTLNSPDFSDQNTVIYGHRMKNKSMFYHLEDYKKTTFWQQYPYFYIYTPDGNVNTYHIFSCSTVNAESPTYESYFGEEKEFNAMIKSIKNAGYYDTGIDVPYGSKIVTLSTCTAASDENRIVLRGVLVETNSAY